MKQTSLRKSFVTLYSLIEAYNRWQDNGINGEKFLILNAFVPSALDLGLVRFGQRENWRGREGEATVDCLGSELAASEIALSTNTGFVDADEVRQAIERLERLQFLKSVVFPEKEF